MPRGTALTYTSIVCGALAVLLLETVGDNFELHGRAQRDPASAGRVGEVGPARATESAAVTGGVPAPSKSALASFALATSLIGAMVKLASENRIFRYVVDEQSPHLDAMNKTALLLTGRFGLLSRVRVGCLMAGGIILPLLGFIGPLTATTRLTLAAFALALCLAGELIERHLFFVAEVAPKMPGGRTA